MLDVDTKKILFSLSGIVRRGHTTKLQVLRLPQQLLFKLWVVLWVVHHALCFVPSEILEKHIDCTFSVTELVEVAVNRCAGKRCVSHVGMFDALRSNTATGRSVTRHFLMMPVFSDATPCQWISGSWHPEGSMAPSSLGSSNTAEKLQISRILTPLPHSISVIGQVPTTFPYN
jgi:hypothetical protein